MYIGLHVQYRYVYRSVCKVPLCLSVCMYSIGYSCQIVMKLEFSGRIFEKYSNINSHEYPSSCSRFVPSERTDGRADVTKLLAILRARLKTSQLMLFSVIMVVCSEIHTNKTHSVGRMWKFLTIKTGGTWKWPPGYKGLNITIKQRYTATGERAQWTTANPHRNYRLNKLNNDQLCGFKYHTANLLAGRY